MHNVPFYSTYAILDQSCPMPTLLGILINTNLRCASNGFIGLRMFDWPEEADFISRHHRLSTHWPPQSLLTECHKLGCVLIPYQPCEM